MLNAKPIVEATRSHLGLGVNAGAITPPVYVPAEKLTEAAACDWIASALVGQSIQYHEGFLMMDRSDSGSGLSAKERSRLAFRSPSHVDRLRTGVGSPVQPEGGRLPLPISRSAVGQYVNAPEIRTRLRQVGTPSHVPATGTH
jgi:hypothetical protein